MEIGGLEARRLTTSEWKEKFGCEAVKGLGVVSETNQAPL